MASTPRLVITDGTIEVDLLDPNSGWKMADPYWNPQISQYKGGGSFVDAQLATGRRLVHKEYGNVVETVPLSLSGISRSIAMKTANTALSLLRQAGNYWTEPYEYDPVWVEINLGCDNCLTGYCRIIKGNIPELTNPFGQPFFGVGLEATMENLTLVFERDPFWQLTKPGEMIGPLCNLIDNPDFELWNNGILNSEPDGWTDIETADITGTNNQERTLVKFGQRSLKIDVTGSTAAGKTKGVTQIFDDTNGTQTYTVIAWVLSKGVSNGVGRILVNYSNQLELYRDSVAHGWTLYTGKITLAGNDTVSINCEILTTDANTVGTIYIDSLMFLQGDYEQEAIDNILPYLSASHIVNHLDPVDADINYVDAWNIPGSADCLIEMRVTNNDTVDYGQVRIGMRRARNVFNFDNYNDPDGTEDLTASNHTIIELTSLDENWTSISDEVITNVTDTQGRFRLLIRVEDTQPNDYAEFRVRYNFGTPGINEKVLNFSRASLSSDWGIIDLTGQQAINYDFKARTLPTQLNYTIEVRRNSSNDGIKFDYSMLLPTDGGFFDSGVLSPALSNDQFLQVSNINEVTQSQISQAQADGWKTFYILTSGFAINFAFTSLSFVGSFKNAIYTAETTNVPEINIVKIDADTTTVIPIASNPGENTPRDVGGWIEFDNKLYYFVDSYVYESDGANFRGDLVIDATGNPLANVVIYFDLFTIQNKLYFVRMFSNVAGGGLWGHDVYTYDGTVSTKIFEDGSDQVITSTSHNGKLFLFGQVTPAVTSLFSKIYDPSDSSITRNILNFPAGEFILSCTSYEGAIIILSTAGKIYSYSNGVDVQLLDNNIPTAISSIGTFDNELYAVSATTQLYKSLNGINWEVINSALNVTFLARPVNGNLYGTNPAKNIVFSLVSSTESYGVTQFRGNPFLAPARTKKSSKRHRYFFSYDRRNGINNIDDKALVVIGFAPRYLELPAKEVE